MAGEESREEDGVVPPCRGGRDDLYLGTTSSKGRESRNDFPLTMNLDCESSSLDIVFSDTTEPNGLEPPRLDPMTHPTTIPMETSPTLFLVVADIIMDGDEAIHAASYAEGK